MPSQEIQFVVHGQTQTHIANTPGTQHFDDATPHGPEKDHLQAPTPPPEDVFMSAPQAGVDDSHEELSSAPTVNVGNFNPRLGEQETVCHASVDMSNINIHGTVRRSRVSEVTVISICSRAIKTKTRYIIVCSRTA